MLRRLKNPLGYFVFAALAISVAVALYFHVPVSRLPSSEISPGSESNTGPDLPTKGSSNFDIVFSKKSGEAFNYDIPFPFERFIQKLESFTGKKTNKNDESGLVGSLFPMGRSLQRNAAIHGQKVENADLFFRYPRVVVGVDGESRSDSQLQINLKNKFYAGYNEKAEILEVVSYNELMGRFEYQIVNDYAPGKSPKVRYANRALCLTCHQNQAPIFSKAPWSESNANPAIAEELKRVLGSESYQGLALAVDESITGRFDTSTDMANTLPILQKIWKEICLTDECKANAILSALQFRLNRGQLFSNDPGLKKWLETFEVDWKTQWPRGLAVPSADILNRDPFKEIALSQDLSQLDDVKKKFSSVSQLLGHSQIPAMFEPLIPRGPAEIWTSSGINNAEGNRFSKGLSQEFTQSDIKAIDNWLKNNYSNNPVATVQSSCRIEKTKDALLIDCPYSESNKFSFSLLVKQNEANASISQFRMSSAGTNGEENLNASGVSGKIQHLQSKVRISLYSSEQILLRTQSGFLISDVVIDLNSGAATLQLFDQSSALRQIINEILKASESFEIFSRFQFMKYFITISGQGLTIPQIDRPGLPLQLSDEGTSVPFDGAQSGLNLIKNNCRACHQNNEAAPSNFLGTLTDQLTDQDICRRIEVCAPRMIYRLKVRLCNLADIKNKKIPMPPDFFLSNHKISHQKWMEEYNPKILAFLNKLVIENDLARDIQAGGLTQTEAINLSRDVLSDKCPDSSSIMYDRLPKCEFEELKAATHCR